MSDLNPNFRAAQQPFKDKKAAAEERWRNLINFVKNLPPEKKTDIPEIPKEPDPTWMDTVESFRNNYSQSQQQPRSGNPDNNSPGANVPTGRRSLLSEIRETTNSTEIQGGMSAPKPRSLLSSEFAEARNEKKPVEADRSKQDSPEAYDWVFSYTPGEDQNRDGEMIQFLKSKRLITSDNASRDDIARAVVRWRGNNGYAELDNDALRKLAREMGGASR